MLYLLLILLICCLLIFYFYKPSQKLTAYQVNDKFNLNSKSDVLYQPFDELTTVVNKPSEAKLILFSDYAEIDRMLDNLAFSPKSYVYALSGTDLMASKSQLARFLRKEYLPRTYIFGQDAMNLDPNKIYFLKKNIQRQEGNLITRDIKYIKTKAEQDGYVVCQELLQNPFLVNNRKINLRVYFLLVCDKTLKFYIYHDGFMYYTPEFFKKNSVKRDENITTGYIDRKVYDENPLTHHDFFKWLGKEKTAVLQNNMIALFRALKEAYGQTLYDLNKSSKNVRFNLYGADIAPDENLNVTIMEINKAPDLSYKDERDGNVKLNMVKDMLALVGLYKGNKNNFVSI